LKNPGHYNVIAFSKFFEIVVNIKFLNYRVWYVQIVCQNMCVTDKQKQPTLLKNKQAKECQNDEYNK